MQRQVFITDDYTETQKVAETFVKQLSSEGLNPSRGSTPITASVIALYGELGSGKTTFVQGLTKGLRIKRRIISPTFIIVRTYKIDIKYQIAKIKNTKQKLKMFYHIDLYRVESVRDIEGLGIREILNDPQNIIAIEWAEKMGQLLPQKRWEIRFRYVQEHKREITIEKI